MNSEDSAIITGQVNVSAALKSTVAAAIAGFGYRPNAAARGLALGKTRTLGVVAQAIDSPFYGEGFRCIEACLRHRGYAQDEEACMRELISRGVDGIIGKLKRYARDVPIVVTRRQLRSQRRKNVVAFW